MDKVRMPVPDTETQFLMGMLAIQYGQQTGQNAISRLTGLADLIPWARGWPHDRCAFWNAEAFMWQRKIDAGVRKAIFQELQFLRSGKNLDLGCGAYSYLPSVGLDISPKMLQFNDKCIERITGDLEKVLPFTDISFDSVTAIFVLNYMTNFRLLLQEIFRILKSGGYFIAVLSSRRINAWQRQQEATIFTKHEWEDALRAVGFSVSSIFKNKLWFFRCQKKNGIT